MICLENYLSVGQSLAFLATWGPERQSVGPRTPGRPAGRRSAQCKGRARVAHPQAGVSLSLKSMSPTGFVPMDLHGLLRPLSSQSLLANPTAQAVEVTVVGPASQLRLERGILGPSYFQS